VYQLYIANKNYSSWSLRPWVLLKALGIPFEERLHPFESTHNFERFRKFSPSGKVPCLVDGDITVWDSLAIAEYLAERHSTVWPSDVHARAWARCAAAEMHSSFAVLRDKCSMNCGVRVKLNEFSAALKKDVDRVDELWCEGLKRFGGPYLAGATFTAVDAFYAPVVFRAQTYGLSLRNPAADYAARMLALPSMRAWYDAALVEMWRDEEHDQDIVRNGAIVEDLRAV
jgi:glutathione S-transferase